MSELLSPQTTADFLGIKAQTLATWRCVGRYDLPFVRVGRKIRYRREDIEAFVERNTEKPAALAAGG